jgi:hypothetical protein
MDILGVFIMVFGLIQGNILVFLLGVLIWLMAD